MNKKRLPTEVTVSAPEKGACLDGDGDRLVYFKRTDKRPLVIDGDKQWSLIMMWIVEKLEMLMLTDTVSHCLINTAYTNSQCFKFLSSNDITNVQAPSGVKNAWYDARKYVIGANCEFNGHGTLYTNWDWLDKALVGKEHKIEAQKLRALLRIANPTCVDGITQLLLVEAILRDKDYGVTQFSKLYNEYPSQLSKASVANKRNFQTTLDETKLVDPQRL